MRAVPAGQLLRQRLTLAIQHTSRGDSTRLASIRLFEHPYETYLVGGAAIVACVSVALAAASGSARRDLAVGIILAAVMLIIALAR